MPRPLFLLLFLGALPLVACPTVGSGDDDDSVGDDDDSTAYVAPGPWAELDFEERKDYMTYEVLPTMEPLFRAFDADEYADFACETCHGEDREEVEYAMPNGVAPLALSGFPFSQSDDPREAAYGEFMEDEVYPTMAELLDKQPTPQQFSCYDCHEQD